MEALTLSPTQKAFYEGIKVTTASGKPAKLDTQDRQLGIEVVNGDASGEISNVREYTEDGQVGDMFDLTILHGSASSASQVDVVGDADNDAGEVRELRLSFGVITKAEEAAGFTLPTPVISEA